MERIRNRRLFFDGNFIFTSRDIIYICGSTVLFLKDKYEFETIDASLNILKNHSLFIHNLSLIYIHMNCDIMIYIAFFYLVFFFFFVLFYNDLYFLYNWDLENITYGERKILIKSAIPVLLQHFQQQQ